MIPPPLTPPPLTPSPLNYASPGLQFMLQSELRPDEQLVWTGQPVRRPFTSGSITLLVIGIPFTLVPLLGIGSFILSIFSNRPSQIFGGCFAFFALPFLLLGIGMVTAPLRTSMGTKSILYAITTRRVLLMGIGRNGQRAVYSYGREHLARLQRIERPGGFGDLIFEEIVVPQGTTVTASKRGFINVAQVRQVEEILRQTLMSQRVQSL